MRSARLSRAFRERQKAIAPPSPKRRAADMTSRTNVLRIVSSTEVKIDKGIPYAGKPRQSRYRWREMEVGDSFLIPTDVEISSFSCVIAQAQRATGRKFSYRKVWDDTG